MNDTYSRRRDKWRDLVNCNKSRTSIVHQVAACYHCRPSSHILSISTPWRTKRENMTHSYRKRVRLARWFFLSQPTHVYRIPLQLISGILPYGSSAPSSAWNKIPSSLERSWHPAHTSPHTESTKIYSRNPPRRPTWASNCIWWWLWRVFKTVTRRFKEHTTKTIHCKRRFQVLELSKNTAVDRTQIYTNYWYKWLRSAQTLMKE